MASLCEVSSGAIVGGSLIAWSRASLAVGVVACFTPPAPADDCSRPCASDLNCPGAQTCAAFGRCVDDDQAVVCEPPTWVDVVAGNNYACARGGDGRLWCWGDNTFGQAAPPLLARAGVAGVVAAAPVTLPDGSDAIFERVDLGEIFGCGVVPGPSAQVACWGSNLAGQVTTVATVDGDEVQPVTVVPGLLFDGERVVDLQVRRLHACVIVEPATGPAEIRCWGGKGGNVLRNTPEDPDAGDTFLGGISGAAVAVTRFDDEGGAPVAVALGNEHTCALRSGGAIECWGSDLFGQLGGPGFEAARRTPLTVPVEIIAPQAIAAGGSHTFALDGDGQIWSWGNPASPALGRPVGIDGGEVPVVLDVPHHADRFAAAGTSGGALAEGALWCWGDNSAGLLPGHPTADGRTPTLIADLATAPASRAAVGARFACATDGDRVVCWGQNSFGSACPSATNEIVESCQIVFDEP